VNHDPPLRVETLYVSHNHWLVGWLYRRIGCRYDAADLAQDTFLKLLARPGKLENMKTPRKWLSVIARGLMIDLFRRKAVEAAYSRSLATMEAPVDISPEARALLLETLDRINTDLEGISPKARTAFLLSRLEGMTYAQIAERLQVSTSSVEKYMASAMRHCLKVSRDR